MSSFHLKGENMTNEERAVYHYSFALDKAKGKATPGSVLVVKEWGKGNKEFEFKNLEHIKIDGVEVCDIINDINTKFKVLCEEINSQRKKIDLLEQTIKKLAEYIDNQRFL